MNCALQSMLIIFLVRLVLVAWLVMLMFCCFLSLIATLNNVQLLISHFLTRYAEILHVIGIYISLNICKL